MVIPRTWMREKSGNLLVKTVHKENRIELQSKWCWHLQTADTLSSDPRVHYPEECSRAKVVENCQYTIAPTRKRLKLFLAQLFLSISSVFTEQSQKCVKNVTPAIIEQGDLLWQDNLTHRSCQARWRHTYLWPMILHKKKIYCKDTRNKLKSYRNKTEWFNFCIDAGFLTTVDVGTVLHDKRHWRILTIHRFSGLPWVHIAKMVKIYLNQKVGFEGTLRLDPYWKSQLAANNVNMEWKSELSLWTRTILTRGSEFLMAWISWSQTWTTTSKKP